MSAINFPPTAGQARSYRSGRTVTALILREMSTRYGRSPGGYIWALLEPLGSIFALALAFSLLVRTPPLGTSFILFYATGFVPFTLYQSLANTIARALDFSRPLLRYPTVTWVDALVARFLLNTLTGLVVASLVFVIIRQISDTRTLLNVLPILHALGLSLLLGAAIGTLNCALGGLINIWDMTWSILTRPLFLASGVLFLYEGMPTGVQNVLWFNPLMHITGILRMGFYPTYNPTYVSSLYCIGFSLITLFLGVVLLRRYHREILNR